MGYFSELPDIAYQSPLLHKNSSSDYVIIKNIFRRAKLASYIRGAAFRFDKYVIADDDRPDTIAHGLYGDSGLDYVVVLVAGIVNINHQWPLKDQDVADYALNKYGSEEQMFANHHYETFEIIDDQGRQILPPNLIVDKDFKIDGSALKYPSIRYTLKSQAGHTQLDDKNQYTVLTDNIARAVTNAEYEFTENEKKREINVLKNSYLNIFINDLRDVLKYSNSSEYISPTLAQTANTEVVNP